MRERVGVEGEAEVLLCGCEDGLAARKAGIVDEDGWVAQGAADGRGRALDRGWR